MKHSALVIKPAAGLRNSSQLPRSRHALLIVWSVASLTCLALLPARASLIPPPDGGYANANTAEGTAALIDLNLNSSSDNTAMGDSVMSLASVVTGNTAMGSATMEFCDGDYNVGIGASALFQVSGDNNTAVGSFALGIDISGQDNTAVGEGAVGGNVDGSNNVGIGFDALGNNNGSSNIGIGESAGINLTSGKNNIDIGNAGMAGESAKIRIGNKANKSTFIAGISGVTVAGGVGVVVNNSGQLGVATSSARYKEAIKPMNKASETILELKPVTFRYKKDLDPDAIPQFGLVAEDVAKVNPDLVARDGEGKPYTVRYDAVNAMLLNEFLKEHRKVEVQAQKEEKLEAIIARQEKAIARLTSQVQKVSDQVALRKAAPQRIASDR
jgi:hypothetical protein